MLFIRKIFIEKYIIDLIQKRNYNNIIKIRQKELFEYKNI